MRAGLRSWPLWNTRFRSMSWIVDSRCATEIVVRSATGTAVASRMSSSVSVSTLGRRLVEDEDPRIERRPRKQQQLLLPPTASSRARRQPASPWRGGL